MYSIYKITNKIDGRIYIGWTSKGIDKRWAKHLDQAKYHYGTGCLHRCINKYGSENFSIELIEKLEEKQYSLDREICWIAYYNSRDPSIGMNITVGGQSGTLGHRWSEESRDKIRGKNNHNYGKPLTDDTKSKLSIVLSGENNPFYGRCHTDESKKQMSDSQKKLNESAEYRALKSINARGENSGNAKLSDSDIIEIRNKWDNREYSQTEIAKQYNVKPNTINQIVRRKRWTHIK